MAWNPNVYDQFKSERYAPFYDLLALVDNRMNMDVLDLGCGTGELTSFLAAKLPHAMVLGVDSSAEMLEKSSVFVQEQLFFEQRGIEEQLNRETTWDLIFSNAAIQWVDDHKRLLPRMIGCLKAEGQLVVQLPAQNDNILNQLLLELVQEPPYQEVLKSWKRVSPVLSIDAYARILFEEGAKDMTVYEKIYPIIVKNAEQLYDFIAGSALIPYFERMDARTQEAFTVEFKRRISQNFPKAPAFYPFKRIVIAAKF
ncbi:methyltransferase domain-containing protein [Flavobacterium sp. JP2137]|uniref:methyltransferase domain-containing protein n=1 Tax=Flavobacterium sp. JP2137 TaxID=3414510 RepID=UPI003D2FEDB8